VIGNSYEAFSQKKRIGMGKTGVRKEPFKKKLGTVLGDYSRPGGYGLPGLIRPSQHRMKRDSP